MSFRFVAKSLAVILIFTLNLWAMEGVIEFEKSIEDETLENSYHGLCLENEDYWLYILQVLSEGVVRYHPATLTILDKKNSWDGVMAIRGGSTNYSGDVLFDFPFGNGYEITVTVPIGEKSGILSVTKKQTTSLYHKPLQKCSKQSAPN